MKLVRRHCNGNVIEAHDVARDEMYFGAFTNLDGRLDLLSNAERDELGPFVQQKMEQEKEQKLDRRA
ncbi:hypothetical protein PAAG_11471 [Paracoccidioides lutzii Pb01]|uniref:Uncharacterized protein n=1 Tax=Paracoccidioides lutzii (strain ATCC MYA-826 / Pb01) TaxID=502779 RepID=A0A0A2V2Q9_PARBA|nr:hypothetical protein PAAG_11471 [Paracoccidioides lutzii Pb01]KGQ01753.1 hypothetical protein PAAG_11471 [Paracoccidioides lutzii Pb01]